MKKILTMLMCLLLLSGCSSSKINREEQPAPEEGMTAAAPQETTGKWISFLSYRGNDNADGLVSREVLVPEITPEAVLTSLKEDGVVPEEVSVLTLTQKEQELTIDFNAAFLQALCSAGTAGETMLVNSVVNTFLSAYDAQSIRITVEGAIPESGHMIYDFSLTHQD